MPLPLPPQPPQYPDKAALSNYNIQLTEWFVLLTNFVNTEQSALSALTTTVETEHP
jgi:hypothetical protein